MPGALVGTLTLDRNPTNFFAETEQVAFHTGHLVPGHRRHRRPAAAGPAVLVPRHPAHPAGRTRTSPSSRSTARVAPVNDNQRDGFVPAGRPPGRAPVPARTRSAAAARSPVGDDGGYVTRPAARSTAPKVRDAAASFDDHYGQATLFWNSMTDVEQDHIVGAFTFELGKCVDPEVRERMLANLANVDADLCEQVAANLGLPAPAGSPAADAGSSAVALPGPLRLRAHRRTGGRRPGRSRGRRRRRRDPAPPPRGAGRHHLRHRPERRVIEGDGGSIRVDRTVLTTQSVEYDALVVAGGTSASALAADPYAAAQPRRGVPAPQDHRRMGRGPGRARPMQHRRRCGRRGRGR